MNKETEYVSWYWEMLGDFPVPDILPPEEQFDDTTENEGDPIPRTYESFTGQVDEIPSDALTWTFQGYGVRNSGARIYVWKPVSPAEASDYYMTEFEEFSPSELATRRKRGTETIRKNVRSAKMKILVLANIEGDDHRPADAPPLEEAQYDLPTVDGESESNDETATIYQTRSTYARSEAVKQVARKRAGGLCENCQKETFRTEDGRPYLEVHHLDELAEGGADTIENVVALCAGCHARVHHGADGAGINEQLRTVRTEREDVE